MTNQPNDIEHALKRFLGLGSCLRWVNHGGHVRAAGRLRRHPRPGTLRLLWGRVLPATSTPAGHDTRRVHLPRLRTLVDTHDRRKATETAGARSPSGLEKFRHLVDLRVACTVADRAGRTVPDADDVAEALGMRLQRVAA
jgi:hypothetical protein